MRILTLIVCGIFLIKFTFAERIIQDSNLTIGSGSAGNVTIKANQGDANPPKLQFDDTTNKWKKSDDGTSFLNMGDMVGPNSVTDNRIPKFEGTTGKEVIETGVDISDSNVITGLGGITSSGTINASGLLVLSSNTTNTQSGTNVNLTASTASVIRLTGTPLASIGGYESTISGRYTFIINETGSSLTINNLDGLVTATNQIRTGTGADYTMVNGTSVTLLYNATTQKHHIVSTSPITAGALPVLTKGQLVTHNGTSVVAANACADGEVIEWDSTQTNGFKCVTKPLVRKYIQRLITAGAGTWTRSSSNVKKVEFYYCGGGGAGGGALVTAAAQVAYGTGGESGKTLKCTIYNPGSTISVSIGSGGTGVTGGTGLSGTATDITGCTSSPGGTGGSAPAVVTGQRLVFATSNFNVNPSIADNGDTIFYTSGLDDDVYYSSTLNEAYSGRGKSAFPAVPEMIVWKTGGRETSSTGTSSVAATCGGGGGALNLASQATAKAGGLGGSGQIVSYEYE